MKAASHGQSTSQHNETTAKPNDDTDLRNMDVDISLVQEVIMRLGLCEECLGDRMCYLGTLFHHVSEVSSYVKMTARCRIFVIG